MNETDPIKYCFHGQHHATRASFRWLPGVDSQGRRKQVCEACYLKIVAGRKQAKERA